MTHNQSRYHSILVSFFMKTAFSRRKVRELPWQLMVSGDVGRLYDLYSDLLFFHLAWRTDRYETKEFWNFIEKNSSYTPSGAYQPLIKSPTDDKISYCEDISDFLLDTFHIKDAIPLLEFQVQYYRRKDYKFHLIRSIAGYATALREAAMFGPAMKWYTEQEQIAKDGGHQHEYHKALGNQASIHIIQAQTDTAIDLLSRQEKIIRALNDRYNLIICLNNQAIALRDLGDTTKSRKVLEEALENAKATDLELTAVCWFNLGVLMHDEGNSYQAGLKFSSYLEELKRVGRTDRIASALGNLGVIEMQTGNLLKALEFLDRQEEICLKINDQIILLTCLCNKAKINIKQQKTDIASDLLFKAEKIARKLELPEGLCRSLSGQALLAAVSGESIKAGILLKEAGELASVHRLAFLQKEIRTLENMIANKNFSSMNITGWVIPIVLVSPPSITGKSVDMHVETSLLMPDWSLMDEEEILSFIKNGGNPQLTDKDGGTALMSAAAMKNNSLTRYLISLHVDVNACDTDGTTALMIASNKGDSEIMIQLINAGAKVNCSKEDGFTPLLFAVQSGNPPAVKLLLESGANPDQASAQGLAPLHLAAYKCSQELVNNLLRHGAHPHKKTNDGTTAYDIARDRCPDLIFD